MEFWQEIMVKSSCSPKTSDISKITDYVEGECYKALKEIKNIIENDDLDDRECFDKIEAIVRVFEILGSSCGNRHDFG